MKKFSLALLAFLLFLSFTTLSSVSAQNSQVWTPAQRIPGYDFDTNPPILIADSDRTVHAFSSQWVNRDNAFPTRAIIYNQWTLNQGWTKPVDILLSPLKNEARLIDAFLDESGMFHVIFFGGDNTSAQIYYAKAPMKDANKVSAWSTPFVVGEDAMDPENGAINGDEKGNLVIIYSGSLIGRGYYAVYSTDGGTTWSKPISFFTTAPVDLIPSGFKIYKTKSGWLHAIWATFSKEGQGRGIFYARFNMQEKQWSHPIELVRTDSGYGAQIPFIVEYGGEVFAMYYFPPKIVMRRSDDNGITWSDPVAPFRHVGNNGPGSLVIDSSDNLHLIWGERITGSPDIHGIWHTIWKNGHWPEPEAVISGPSVFDQTGDKAFDPSGPKAIISQGNVLMVTWRQDPGLKGNGVWYSYKLLDTPELPIVPFHTITTPFPKTATPDHIQANFLPNPTSTMNGEFVGNTSSQINESPIIQISIGFISSIIVIFLFVILRLRLNRNG